MSPRLPAALALGCALLACLPSAARASQMSPGQAQLDQRQPGSSLTGGTWSDLEGGVAARPYVKSISVVDGGGSTQVFSGGVEAAAGVAQGDVTAVVAPVNLCAPGQTPAQGQCYASPNRVQISFGLSMGQMGLERDFAAPAVTPLRTVGADTVLDVVIGLNTLGRTLRWSWANGELVDWRTSDLGADDAEIRLRIKPALTPDIGPGQDFGGCSATPIRDCDLQQAAGTHLGADLLLSLDDTLPTPLTGAVFATEGAIAGFLLPGGTSASPTLDVQMAGPHLEAGGAVHRGAMQAFLPAQALVSLYGVVPADAASFFTATRRNDPGTQAAPRFTTRARSDTSDAGLLVSIDDISFSAPAYRVARKSAPVRVRARVARGATTVSTAAVRACRDRGCTVALYRLRGELTGRSVRVAQGRTDAAGAATLRVTASKLGRRGRYILAVRKRGRLITSTRGTVG